MDVEERRKSKRYKREGKGSFIRKQGEENFSVLKARKERRREEYLKGGRM